MKTKYAIAAALLISISAFAQKDELKAMKKLSEKSTNPTPQDMQEFKALIDKATPLMANATPEQQADYYYYKGGFAVVSMIANQAQAKTLLPTAVEDLNKVIEIEKTAKKKTHTGKIEKEIFPQLKNLAAIVASQQSQQKDLKEAARFYTIAYQLDPKDYFTLYNAAAVAVNAQEYDKALEYYLVLDNAGFTGEMTNYSAKNLKTGEVEYFNKETRDLLVKQKLYSDPQEVKQESLKGEIVKNIALIYNQKGDTEKAKQAMANARKSNPDDLNLLIAEAELYMKTNDMEMYKKLIGEATQKNPTNADLFYNLGVVSGKTDKAEGIKNYEKALSINPNHVNANNNMGTLILSDEEKIVKEMNGLGNTAKDNKRYDELKGQRDAMYKKSLPYFERAVKQDPNNEYAIAMLANLYQALEMQAEAKAMKAKVKK